MTSNEPGPGRPGGGYGGRPDPTYGYGPPAQPHNPPPSWGPPPGGGQAAPPQGGGHGPPPSGGYGGPPPPGGGYGAPPSGGYPPPPGGGGFPPPPGGGGFPPPPGGGGFPPPPGGGRPAPRRGRRGLLIGAIVAVLALIAGGVAVATLLGNRGGAGSAGEAVQLLASDLSTQNYVNAYSRLHPGEAELSTDLGNLFVDELKRLDVLRPDADLNTSTGTFTVADLRFDEAAQEQVREDVVITKLVGGTITTEQNPADIPFTDSFRQLAFPEGLPPTEEPMTMDIAQIVAEQGEPIRVASVRVDGSWYVSGFYTAADYALRAGGLVWPQQSIAPRGAATAQDALRETVQAALDQDVRRLVELAPPDELAVIHDIGEVLIADASGTPTGARIVELDADEVEVRGRPALFVTRVVVADPSGTQLTAVRDGDCVSIEAGGPPQRVCAADLAAQGGLPLTDPALAPLAGLLPDAVQALLEVKIVTTEVDGQHYVSPVRTVVGIYADLFGVLDRQDLADLINASR